MSEDRENPPQVSSAKPPCTYDDAMEVLTRLRDAGHVAYFAGGCVRDLLLGHEPKDWDVATDATPPRVRSLFLNTQAVGAAFGVILVHIRRSVVEVATFRADADYIDGRHPTGVRFTTAEEDARRRDFTINGLFLDPLRRGALEEQIIDYVAGRADLHARVIRAIGDPEARFREDHLRLLRAVRFAARFDFSLEPHTAGAIAKHAAHLVRISPERIADELRLMLTASSRGKAYALLEELGLRDQLFRFWEFPRGTGALARSQSVFRLLGDGETIQFALALAGASVDHYLWNGPPNADVRRLLERPIAQKLVRAFRQALKISNEESDALLGILEGLDPLLDAGAEPRVARLKRFLARPTSRLSRRLLQALQAAGAVDPERVRWLQQRLADLEKTDVAPRPLVTGDDLTAAGFLPGPKFKTILDGVYDAQLEDQVTTRDSAMELARRIAGSA